MAVVVTLTRRGRRLVAVLLLACAAWFGHATSDICWNGDHYGRCAHLEP